MLGRAHRGDALAEFPHFRGEVPAGDEIGLGHRAALNAQRFNPPAALFAEVDDVEGLLDVQRACFPARVAAVVVVHAIGEVGVLLDLAEHHTRADCVHRAGGNEDGFAGLHWQMLYTVLRRALQDGLAERLARHARLQAHHHLCAWPRGNGVPHLRFADPACVRFVFPRVVVVRVHLHRELFFGEDEFHQQREVWLPRQTRPGPFGGHLRPGFAHSMPGPVAGGKDAIMTGEPGFADGLLGDGSIRKQRSQRTRAPDPWIKGRGETERGELHDWGLTERRNLSSRRRPSSMRSIEVA